jgi:hypothetical protein
LEVLLNILGFIALAMACISAILERPKKKRKE